LDSRIKDLWGGKKIVRQEAATKYTESLEKIWEKGEENPEKKPK